MSCPRITAITGLSDPQTLVLGYKTSGVVTAFDFSTATKVAARFDQAGTIIDTFDSDADAGMFDYDNGGGELVVDFGLTALDAGTYNVRIIVTSPAYPTGLVLNRGDGYTLDVEMIE